MQITGGGRLWRRGQASGADDGVHAAGTREIPAGRCRGRSCRAITHVHAGRDGRSLRSSEDRGMIDFIEAERWRAKPRRAGHQRGRRGLSADVRIRRWREAPAKGEKWRCHTSLNVREDAMELFGFATSERAMFKRLCQVTGVARRRRWACSRRCYSDLSVAIVTGDVAASRTGRGQEDGSAHRAGAEG